MREYHVPDPTFSVPGTTVSRGSIVEKSFSFEGHSGRLIVNPRSPWVLPRNYVQVRVR